LVGPGTAKIADAGDDGVHPIALNRAPD
jgi:hypothetical protein